MHSRSHSAKQVKRPEHRKFRPFYVDSHRLLYIPKHNAPARSHLHRQRKTNSRPDTYFTTDMDRFFVRFDDMLADGQA